MGGKLTPEAAVVCFTAITGLVLVTVTAALVVTVAQAGLAPIGIGVAALLSLRWFGKRLLRTDGRALREVPGHPPGNDDL